MPRWLLVVVLVVALHGPLWAAGGSPVSLHYFWAEGCPHCIVARPRLEALVAVYPGVRLHSYEISRDRANLELLRQLCREAAQPIVATPAVLLADRLWVGFDDSVERDIAEVLQRCQKEGCEDLLAAVGASPTNPKPAPTQAEKVAVPLLGTHAAADLSLPLLTVVLGLLDSFNPCAFFVLFFLLSLLLHARSRRTMWLVGGTFVLCSGLLYFLFMTAWLNLFLLVGQLRWLTVAAGILAVVVAAINIKDYFLFHVGITLSIPEQAKPGLFARMRRLLRAGRLSSLLGGTLVLALAANSYELLCTAGFPLVYTRILTLRDLPAGHYYLWLGLYNLIYILPLLAIVALFVVTLGRRTLSEEHGRLLKLLSGCMMLLLGFALLWRPALLGNPWIAAALLPAALLLSWIFTRLRRPGTRHLPTKML